MTRKSEAVSSGAHDKEPRLVLAFPNIRASMRKASVVYLLKALKQENYLGRR